MKHLKIHFILCFLFLLFLDNVSWGQIGGNSTYKFLNLSNSARITALGDSPIAIKDQDISLTFDNPSLYNPLMDDQLVVANNFYFSDINHGYVGYAKSLDSLTTVGIGVKYISYGQISETDISGNVIGEFSGGENAVVIGAARQFDRLSIGLNLKAILSSMANYTSTGLSTDLGFSYQVPHNGLNMSLLFKNMGLQLSSYDGDREKLPFEIQFGLTQRLQHLPLRLSVLVNNIQKFDIRYDDPTVVDNNIFVQDDSSEDKRYLTDKMLRHLAFGVELYLGKNVILRAGYNHLRRRELNVGTLRSFAGFSMGAEIKIKRFQIAYGRAIYHLAGGSNHLSIQMNLRKITNRQ